MKLRVCVTGGRSFKHKPTIFAALDWMARHRGIGTLAHGGSSGADQIAGEWADAHGVQLVIYPAPWSRGPCAGPQRNAVMLSDFRPDVLIHFPGGSGTRDAINKAETREVEVLDGLQLAKWGQLE